MNKNHDINTLVSKLLTGEISEEEGKELLTRVEQDTSLKDKIEHLMNEDDFLLRYRLYKSIDAEKAKATFKASLQQTEEQEDRNNDKSTTLHPVAPHCRCSSYRPHSNGYMDVFRTSGFQPTSRHHRRTASSHRTGSAERHEWSYPHHQRQNHQGERCTGGIGTNRRGN